MNEALLALVSVLGTLAGVILGAYLIHLNDESRRRRLKDTFITSLGQEIRIVRASLSDLLVKFPNRSGAHTTDSFFQSVCAVRADLFAGLLPHLEVMPSDITRDLAHVYLTLAITQARARTVLDRGGSAVVSGGETDPIWDEIIALVAEMKGLEDGLLTV